jgi:hypothetical protein
MLLPRFFAYALGEATTHRSNMIAAHWPKSIFLSMGSILFEMSELVLLGAGSGCTKSAGPAAFFFSYSANNSVTNKGDLARASSSATATKCSAQFKPTAMDSEKTIFLHLNATSLRDFYTVAEVLCIRAGKGDRA